jgi:molybdopterin-guanine dinucleotide biosynthesis protein MobB
VVVKEAAERRAGVGIGGGGGDRVLVVRRAAVGDHVRRAGEEYRAGDPILEPGLRLGPAAIGLLATAGIEEVEVVRQPRVAILTTGDELVPGCCREMAPHTLRDSNGPLLEALCRRAGAIVSSRMHLGDDLPAISRWIESQAASADVLITTGGASVGDQDLVAGAWQRAGVATEFWGVAMKPGKPVRFGTLFRPSLGRAPRPVFGLSGNPLAALTQFDLLVAPLLAYMAGWGWNHQTRIRVPLADGARRGGGGVPEFRRGREDGSGDLSLLLTARAGSGMLRGAAASPFLVRLPAAGETQLEGASAEAIAESDALRGRTWRPAPELPFLVGIRGRSGSGKTTLIEALLPRLTALGIRTGTVKHAHKGATLDVRGKDSERHAAAGAACVLLLAPGQAGFFVPRDAEPNPGDWLECFAGRVDLVLIEGFSTLSIPCVTVTPASGSAAAFEPTGDGWHLSWPRGRALGERLLDRIVAEVARRLADAKRGDR